MSNSYNNVYPVNYNGQPINQPVNMNVPVHTTPVYTNSNHIDMTPGAGYTTGTQKVVIKQDANGYVAKEKTSTHNPFTGVSEKIKTKA